MRMLILSEKQLASSLLSPETASLRFNRLLERRLVQHNAHAPLPSSLHATFSSADLFIQPKQWNSASFSLIC